MHAGRISSGRAATCVHSQTATGVCVGVRKKVVGPLKLLNILPCLLSAPKTSNKRSAFQLRGSPPNPPVTTATALSCRSPKRRTMETNPRPIQSFCLSLPPPPLLAFPLPPPLLTTGWKDDLKLLLKPVTFK